MPLFPGGMQSSDEGLRGWADLSLNPRFTATDSVSLSKVCFLFLFLFFCFLTPLSLGSVNYEMGIVIPTLQRCHKKSMKYVCGELNTVLGTNQHPQVGSYLFPFCPGIWVIVPFTSIIWFESMKM